MADGGDIQPAHPWTAGLQAANVNRALAALPEDQRKPVMLSVLARVAEGEKTKDIAAQFGISRVRLNQLLLQYAEDDWRSLQVAKAISEREEATDQLEAAQDGLTLARARERLKAAQWDLERLLSRLFGPKQEVTVHQGEDWGERLRRAKGRVIDAEPVDNAAQHEVVNAELIASSAQSTDNA